MSKTNLLKAWAEWKLGSAPFVLDDDQNVFSSPRSQKSIITNCSWQEAIEAPNFGAPGDTRLHLGLLPIPFIGDIQRATIYILLLNPGIGPHDYYGEYEVPKYRAALQSNLKQQFVRGSTPFIFLDPQFAWHGGFTWWHGKLSKVIEKLSTAWKVPFATARSRLAANMAAIELLPYHSVSFKDGDRWLKNLPSVKLARNFIDDFVLKRVQSGKAIVIVTRKVAEWNLPKQKGIVTYTPAQTRSAHLTPGTPGGNAILTHFGVQT